MGGRIYRFDPAVEHECKKIQQRIFQTRGYTLSLVQASKVLAWKSANSSKTLPDSVLLEILGGAR